MSKAQLKKATITVLEGADKSKVISVLFNPTEYTLERSNSYKSTPVPGLGSPLIQFVNGESDHLSMDLFMDDYTDPIGPTTLQQKEDKPLTKRLADLWKLLEIDRDLHAPPPVRFNWGPMEFQAIIEKLGQSHDVSSRRRSGSRDDFGELQGIPNTPSTTRGSTTRVGR